MNEIDGVSEVLEKQKSSLALGSTLASGVRRSALARLAGTLKENRERVLRVISSEYGRGDNGVAIDEYSAALSAIADAKRMISCDLSRARSGVALLPMGAVLVTAPAAESFAFCVSNLARAVACGCAVTLKPSGRYPETAKLICHIANSCFSREQANVLLCDRKSLEGIFSLDWSAIYVAGSADTAESALCEAAKKRVPVYFDIALPTAVIVSSNADIERAAKAVALAKARLSGQYFGAPEAVYVERPAYEAFVESCSAAMRGLAEAPRVGVWPDRYDDLKEKLKSADMAFGDADDEMNFLPNAVFRHKSPMDIALSSTFSPFVDVAPFDKASYALDAISRYEVDRLSIFSKGDELLNAALRRGMAYYLAADSIGAHSSRFNFARSASVSRG